MPLDPQLIALAAAAKGAGYGELSALPLAELRRAAREPYVPPGPPVKCEQHGMPGPGGELQLTAYRAAAGDAAGALLFFADGGFVLSETAGHAALCRQLAAVSGSVIIAATHRVAPEHKFPAAIDDAYAATCWVHENADVFGFDHQRLAIGGEGSGANLATSVCRLAKERRNPPLRMQLLLYPLLDFRRAEARSRAEHAQGPFLTRAALDFIASSYLRSEADRDDPRCSPLAARNLIGLPEALIITAEHDPLRDEGEAYATALRAAYVPVTQTRYAGAAHGFVQLFAHVDQGRAAVEACSRALQAAFATAPPLTT
jgi:acetyl esterase